MNEHAPTPRRPASYRDVLDAPAGMVAEIANGRLHLHPRPAMRHAYAGSALGSKLGNPFHHDQDGPGGWWIIFEPELHLGPETSPDVLVPDLAGWRRARMPQFPDAPWCELAPDWACEVLSPGTRRLDLTDKRALYGAHGVGHLWLVDPAARTLEAFALQGGAWVLLAALKDDDEVRVPPFAAAAFPLSALWPD
ncbi:hypothetical protein BH23PSE1_BH23PSE1_02470 [soil metagenome]